MQSELVALKKAKIAKYDVLFKCVIEPRHSSLRRMLGIGEAVPLPTDFPGFRSRSVDALYRVGVGVRHVEFQTRDHSTMRWRMLEYFGRIAKREFDLAAGENPVIEQTVLYVGDGRSGMESEIVTDQLEFAFELRDIEEFEEEWSDELLASYYPTDIVLGLLCRPVVALRDWTKAMSDEWIQAAERIERMVRLDPFTAGDADALLLVAALLKNVPDVVKEELEMTLRVDVSRSPIMLSVFNRGYSQAVAEMKANPILELIERHASVNDIPLEADVQEKLTDLDQVALGDVLLGFAAGGDLNDLIVAEVYKRGGPGLEG